MDKQAKPTILVDLDGTLAKYKGWNGHTHIGEPIPIMARRIRRWLREGKLVKIFTARMAEKNPEKRQEIVDAVQAWTEKHFDRRLGVTNEKDSSVVRIWDDRAMSVARNHGRQTKLEFHDKHADEPSLAGQAAKAAVPYADDAILWGAQAAGSAPVRAAGARLAGTTAGQAVGHVVAPAVSKVSPWLAKAAPYARGAGTALGVAQLGANAYGIASGLYDPDAVTRGMAAAAPSPAQRLSAGLGPVSGGKQIGALVRTGWGTVADVATSRDRGAYLKAYRQGVGEGFQDLQKGLTKPSYKWQESAGNTVGSKLGRIGEMFRRDKGRSVQKQAAITPEQEEALGYGGAAALGGLAGGTVAGLGGAAFGALAGLAGLYGMKGGKAVAGASAETPLVRRAGLEKLRQALSRERQLVPQVSETAARWTPAAEAGINAGVTAMVAPFVAGQLRTADRVLTGGEGARVVGQAWNKVKGWEQGALKHGPTPSDVLRRVHDAAKGAPPPPPPVGTPPPVPGRLASGWRRVSALPAEALAKLKAIPVAAWNKVLTRAPVVRAATSAAGSVLSGMREGLPAVAKFTGGAAKVVGGRAATRLIPGVAAGLAGSGIYTGLTNPQFYEDEARNTGMDTDPARQGWGGEALESGKDLLYRDLVGWANVPGRAAAKLRRSVENVARNPFELPPLATGSAAPNPRLTQSQRLAEMVRARYSPQGAKEDLRALSPGLVPWAKEQYAPQRDWWTQSPENTGYEEEWANLAQPAPKLPNESR